MFEDPLSFLALPEDKLRAWDGCGNVRAPALDKAAKDTTQAP